MFKSAEKFIGFVPYWALRISDAMPWIAKNAEDRAGKMLSSIAEEPLIRSFREVRASEVFSQVCLRAGSKNCIPRGLSGTYRRVWITPRA